jgi:hypothetical protein
VFETLNRKAHEDNVKNLASAFYETDADTETVLSGKSSFETVAAGMKKALKMKQNQAGLCFKILSSQYLESTVSQSGPNSTEVIKWATA